MERKSGIAVAGGVTLVLLAGAIAMGANLGLLRAGNSRDPSGRLRPTGESIEGVPIQQPQVVTVELRDPATSSPPAGLTGSEEILETPLPAMGEHEDELEQEHETEHEPEQHVEDEPEHENEVSDDGSGHDD